MLLPYLFTKIHRNELIRININYEMIKWKACQWKNLIWCILQPRSLPFIPRFVRTFNLLPIITKGRSMYNLVAKYEHDMIHVMLGGLV